MGSILGSVKESQRETICNPLIPTSCSQAEAGTLEHSCELARAGVRSAKARVMKQGADRGPGVLGVGARKRASEKRQPALADGSALRGGREEGLGSWVVV